METNDITPRVLATIREDIADLRTDMDAGFKCAHERMDRMDARMDAGFKRADERVDRLGDQLADRITETQMRLSTAIFDLHGRLNDVQGAQHDMQGTLSDMQKMLRDLHARSGRRRRPDD